MPRVPSTKTKRREALLFVYSGDMELNQQQQLATKAGNGPVAIIAGPGTGKTKTLIARLHFLINEGASPNRLLALTFTKKAAEEMIHRFKAEAARPHISTFHALCFDLLTQKHGRQPEFITEPARLALIKSLSRPTALKQFTVRELALAISRAKNGSVQDEAVAMLVRQYNQSLSESDLSDFDDLLLHTRDGLKYDNSWRATIQHRFDHILVDEFQDTNLLQYELLQLLRGNDNLFVIGDPLQSIYGFRGAAGDIFAAFLRDFPTARVIRLSTNYRSSRTVVRLANAVYPEAALVAHTKAEGEVRVIEVLNEYSEAAWVLGQVQQAIGGSDFQRAVSDDQRHDHLALGDMAILYRSRSVARTIQKQLEQSGIPFQVVGEGSPYETTEVQTILQLFAQAVDGSRKATIVGLSPIQISELIKTIDPLSTPHHAAARLAERFDVSLSSTFRQFLGALVRFKTISEAVRYFDSIAAQGFYDPQADSITLLTIHASKGLEFTRVFLIAAEDGVLPAAKGDAHEERRLFYVAITRAKQSLDITFTHTRAGKAARMSPFVSNLTPAVLPRHKDLALEVDQRRALKRHAKRAQTTLF